ncbi:hypothetical protein BDR26DRAFT_936137 [Obelidium mucronatum]|nr:hypothetical protein BDR26DRAFT_936137 [Obelidium mucronatum]
MSHKLQVADILATLDELQQQTTAPTSDASLQRLWTQLSQQQRRVALYAQTGLAAHRAAQARIGGAAAAAGDAQRQIGGVVAALGAQKARLEALLRAAAAARAKARAAAATSAVRPAAAHARIVNYARRLARHTAAGPAGAPSQAHAHVPPIPQDAHMKRSLLFAPQNTDDSVADLNTNNPLDADAMADEPLMELDFMEKLVRNPAHSSSNAEDADGDHVMNEEDELNLDL